MSIKNTILRINKELVLWKSKQLWLNPGHIAKKEVIENTSCKIRGKIGKIITRFQCNL